LRLCRSSGYQVFAVNPNADEVEGDGRMRELVLRGNVVVTYVHAAEPGVNAWIAAQTGVCIWG